MIESIRSKDQSVNDQPTAKKERKQAAKPDHAATETVPAVTPPELNHLDDEPKPAEPAAAKEPYTLSEYLQDEADAQDKADNDDRNDPELRMEMCRVVDELDKMLDDHAAALAHQEGDGGAYNMDIKKDLLTWMLAEFLTRSIIDRNPDEPPMTRGWQVNQAHAFDFYRVSNFSDGSLVALEVEEGRK